MIIIFTHIKFSRTYSPARNARKYVLRENFYVYSKPKLNKVSLQVHDIQKKTYVNLQVHEIQC